MPSTRDVPIRRGGLTGRAALIRILLTDDELRGKSVRIALPDGTTLGTLLDGLDPGSDPAAMDVYVNGTKADRRRLLRNGDRITVKSVDLQSSVYLG